MLPKLNFHNDDPGSAGPGHAPISMHELVVTTVVADEIGNNHLGPRPRIFGVM